MTADYQRTDGCQFGADPYSVRILRPRGCQSADEYDKISAEKS